MTADHVLATGITAALARERAAQLRDVRYALAFVLPGDRLTPVSGQVTIRTVLEAPHRIVLDFEQPRDCIQSVRVHGRDIGWSFANGHLVIPPDATATGENEVEIRFTAGDKALNRQDDFLFTLHVPAQARYTFPCFDQPDLKARYRLTVTVPGGWHVVANGAAPEPDPFAESIIAAARTVHFAETAPLPTYLFSFVAGRFGVERAARAGRTFHMLHRETDAGKVARNREAIFDLHAAALAWLEAYTGMPYPFAKFDFVLIPSFQFGGMEHPGAILYDASRLLLDETATQNQWLERASLIAHETAHIWFGDLVTMRWFDDVWMKEVFANFMAARIVAPSFPGVDHETRFLLTHYPQAYAVDRSDGANPIRQPLENLNEAGQLYGPIIYQKAPIVLRQLELTVGEDALRDAVREYLRRHAFGTASWPDLIRILEARAPAGDVAAWNEAWVEQRGRPSLAISMRVDRHGAIASLELTQSDPLDARALVWPQPVQVTLGYHDGLRHLSVYSNAPRLEVPGASGLPRPLFVLPNGGGLAYGACVLDDQTRTYLMRHLADVADGLTRSAAWLALWDNLLEGSVHPLDFVDAIGRGLTREQDEQIVEHLLARLVRTFWRFLSAEQRSVCAPDIERVLREGTAYAATPTARAAWFDACREIIVTAAGIDWLTALWRGNERIDGLTLGEREHLALAAALAIRELPDADAILQQQLERTQDPDAAARFRFVMPALSPDTGVREAAFDRLRSREYRRREPWVVDCLRYLNHPLREAHAIRFITPALEQLPEIQRTGDIFFPARWIEATLSGHRSPEAADAVRACLAAHHDYPERLRWVILAAADELFRAARSAG